jgi:ABC-type spermidine/putrescine transport system permease subunit I
MSLGLGCDHRLLYPARELPGFGQCQTEIRDIPEVGELTKFQNVEASLRPVRARLHQPYNPAHPQSPTGHDPEGHTAPALISPTFPTLPLRTVRRRAPLLLPAGVLYGLLMVLPLVLVLRLSLTDSLTDYGHVLESRLLGRVVENTLVIGVLTTLIAVFLAYIYAAALWRAGPGLRIVLFGLVLLPFWTGVLVKNFAWAALLQDNGAISRVLRTLGGIEHHASLLHNRFAVVIGMVHYVLPYAVFPIYAAMIAIDQQLERAARSLGASIPRVIWRITLPLTLPGVYAGGLLVFIISIGFFITPVILGGPADMMVANLVDFYAHQLVDFGSAAALAVLVTSVVSVLVYFHQRLRREAQYGGP